MSILIMGMEMPKDGTFNIVHIYSDGHVSMPFWGKGMQIVQGINAVSVPPHGRLIDADALIALLERQINNHEKQAKMADAKGTGYTKDMYICDRNGDIISMLKAVPTIIQKEGET